MRPIGAKQPAATTWTRGPAGTIWHTYTNLYARTGEWAEAFKKMCKGDQRNIPRDMAEEAKRMRAEWLKAREAEK